MKPEIGCITTIFHGSGLTFGDQIRALHELGCDFVDVNENPDTLAPADLREALRYIHTRGVTIRAVFALYDLCITDPQVSREVVASMCRRLDFAALLGGCNMLAGVGRVPAGDSVGKAWITAVEVMRRVCDHAADIGIDVAVELEPYDPALVKDPDSMGAFMADVGSPACKANLDIAHCVLRGISPAQVEAIADSVIHTHLADCDGKVHVESVPGTGVVDFKAYLDPLFARGYHGGNAMEVQPSPNAKELVVQGLAHMRSLYPGA
jgi:D-psicose/D-tagatose/L-ribulose 3-epimerase